MPLKAMTLTGALLLALGCTSQDPPAEVRSEVSSEERKEVLDPEQLRPELLGLDQGAVRARLGEPKHQSSWDTGVPGPDLTPEERSAWESTALEKIWAYPGIEISFSVAGRVRKVEKDSVPSKYASDE